MLCSSKNKHIVEPLKFMYYFFADFIFFIIIIFAQTTTNIHMVG